MQQSFFRWGILFGLTFMLGWYSGAIRQLVGTEREIDVTAAWVLLIDSIGTLGPLLDMDDGRYARAKQNLDQRLVEGMSRLNPHHEASAYLLNDIIDWRAQLEAAGRPDAAVDERLVRIKYWHQELLDQARRKEQLRGD